MPDGLRIFVASSSEQIETAREVAKAFGGGKKLDVHVWEEDVFEFSTSYIESLEKELDRADFAIVILTADDFGSMRQKKVNLPRDNVIFELGLFAGRLERHRCFFFVDGDSDTKIASDLSGVKPVNFYRKKPAADDHKQNLKTQATKVRKQMLALGPRYKPSKKVRDDQEELWRFSRGIAGIAGHWWQRMWEGEDDQSALSYLTVTVDETTNNPRIDGKAYGEDGEPLAEWNTVVTGTVFKEKPIVYYRWKGQFYETPGQLYDGGGQINFDDDSLETASGYFYDTNIARIVEGEVTRVKRFELYRCSKDEIEKMNQTLSDEVRALIRDKLATLHGH